jgi:hypothetical protein
LGGLLKRLKIPPTSPTLNLACIVSSFYIALTPVGLHENLSPEALIEGSITRIFLGPLAPRMFDS